MNPKATLNDVVSLLFRYTEKRKLTPEQIAKKAKSRNSAVRAAIATRHDTPLEVLQQLATDPNGKVVRQVVFNHNLDLTTLHKIAPTWRNKNNNNVQWADDIVYALISHPNSDIALVWKVVEGKTGGPVTNTKRYKLMEYDEETIQEFARSIGVDEDTIDEAEYDELIAHILTK